MDWLKQINQTLSQTRDKSYRKKTDNDIQRSNNCYLLSQSRRVLDSKQCKEIFDEYWRIDQPRMLDFKKVYAKKYNATPGIIERVVDNVYNTVTAEQYDITKALWNAAFPNHRGDVIKKLNQIGKRKPSKGIAHRASLDNVDAVTAGKIYADCLTSKDSRTQKNYQRLAKLYNVKQWQKVRDIANGHHYSLTNVNAEQDIEQWRLDIGEGNYEMTDTDGRSYVFADLRELGYFIQTTEGKPNNNTAKNWAVARNWFEKLEPNTWYIKERRTFKGWKYCNHLPAKYK
jgi:hypothetical protein